MFDFPTNPTNGQVYQNFYFDSSIGTWRNLGSKNALSSAVTDLRTASPITVASQAARDALYPTPVQGQSVFRTDLGVTQRYYGLFNSSTNPGGRDTAGWYNTEKSQGLVPIIPTSIQYSGGTASVNSMGQVSFANTPFISLVGSLTNYRFYKIYYEITTASATDTTLGMRMMTGTSTDIGANYFYGGTMVGHQSANTLVYAASQQQFSLGPISAAGAGSYGIGGHIDIEGANIATQTKMQVQSTAASSAVVYGLTVGGGFLNTTQHDGFQLFPFGSTNFGGVISVYGFNQ